MTKDSIKILKKIYFEYDSATIKEISYDILDQVAETINNNPQIDMIEAGLAPIVADGSCRGVGLWEISLSQGPESGTDHAAKWETSNMLFLYPDRVDMSALGDGPLAPDMKPPDGIGGLDPRTHASAEVGGRNVELCAEAIGRKAQDLLASLPEDQRGFGLESVSPEHWWLI